jgi:predicted nucleic-acid-binding protein
MRVLLDLNVLLDVIQRRESFYQASATILSLARQGSIEAYIPGHGLTTIYYVVARYNSTQKANESIDWLLNWSNIAIEDHAVFQRALSLGFADFEDAVTASAAQASGCELIITRNVTDFSNSPVAVITPEEFLVQWNNRDSDEPDKNR